MKKFKDFFIEAPAADLPPPAIVQKAEIKAPTSTSSFLSPGFLKYIMDAENGIRKGFNRAKGVWTPHKSVEGGTDTIAYGHKLPKGANIDKITEREARVLLVKDLLKASANASQFIDSKYGKGTYNKLSNTQKEILTDYSFNGVLHKFPKFVNGVIKNDKQIMASQYERYVDGVPLKDRNQRFASRYL